MNKFLLFVLAGTLGCAALSGAEPGAAAPEKSVAAREIPGIWLSWVSTQLKAADVYRLLNEAITKIPQKKASSFELMVYARRLQTMADYPYFENDTELDRNWLKDFVAAFNQLGTIQGRISQLKAGTPEYNARINAYDELAARIKGSARNPRICRDKALMRKQREAKEDAIEKMKARQKAYEKRQKEKEKANAR